MRFFSTVVQELASGGGGVLSGSSLFKPLSESWGFGS